MNLLSDSTRVLGIPRALTLSLLRIGLWPSLTIVWRVLAGIDDPVIELPICDDVTILLENCTELSPACTLGLWNARLGIPLLSYLIVSALLLPPISSKGSSALALIAPGWPSFLDPFGDTRICWPLTPLSATDCAWIFCLLLIDESPLCIGSTCECTLIANTD